MGELLVIVRGIGIALRAISVVLVLMGFIVYIGAIVFRILAEGTAVGESHFSSVTAAMGTLLLDCTISGTRGGLVMKEANEDFTPFNFLLTALVFVYVLLGNITLMGVLTGLLVQTVRTTAEVEKEESVVNHISNTVDSLWGRLMRFDSNGDGTIDEEEMQNLFQDVDFIHLMDSEGVDADGFM